MIGRLTSLFAATLLLAAGCTSPGADDNPEAGDRPGVSSPPAPPAGNQPSGAPGVKARPEGLPVDRPLWKGCPPPPEPALRLVDGSDALKLPKLDDTFRPVSARVCTIGSQKRANGGYDRVAIEQSVTDLSTLLPALRLPDEKPTDGRLCTLEGHEVPWMVLLDEQGRYVRPGVPVDACRKPRPEFEATVRKLHSTTVTTRFLGKLTD
ncbi:hypothetical protein [Actinoplanes sp. NPDC089786]|uniref:hypothetical protein n=1 Tax=Actinoplanes sp. NPDC089786 TaxID=3155185 RepID=UPI003438053E